MDGGIFKMREGKSLEKSRLKIPKRYFTYGGGGYSVMAYIHYDQKSNGVIYASLYESFRDNGKVKTRRMESLGRVIDKENNIFCQKGITYQYVLGHL